MSLDKLGRQIPKRTKEWRENVRMGLLRAYAEGKRNLTNVSKRFKENNPNKGKFGKDHPKWTENKKRPFHKSIRQLHQYTEWRKAIFIRDNFKCTQCGNIGYIEADHHPKRFIDIIREHQIKTIDGAINCLALWDINNGRTLCLRCHRKTDTWGRRKD